VDSRSLSAREPYVDRLAARRTLLVVARPLRSPPPSSRGRGGRRGRVETALSRPPGSAAMPGGRDRARARRRRLRLPGDRGAATRVPASSSARSSAGSAHAARALAIVAYLGRARGPRSRASAASRPTRRSPPRRAGRCRRGRTRRTRPAALSLPHGAVFERSSGSSLAALASTTSARTRMPLRDRLLEVALPARQASPGGASPPQRPLQLPGAADTGTRPGARDPVDLSSGSRSQVDVDGLR
jgi:hypothetical protein